MLPAVVEPSPEPFLALMVLGFIIATVGHVYKSNWAVGTGIALIFVVTLLLPVLLYLTS